MPKSRSASSAERDARRERELAALHAIATRVAAASSIEVICRVAAGQTTRLLGHSGAAVLLLSGDDGAETLELVAKDGPVPDALLESLGGPPGRLEKAALRTRRPQVVRDLERVRSSEGDIQAQAQFVDRGFHAAAMIPIVAGKRAFGILAVVAGESKALDRRAVEVLSDVARNIAIALEKRRLLENAERRVEDVRFFRDVSGWLAGTIDLDKVLARICKNLTELVDVTQCYVILHDRDARELYMTAGSPSSGELSREMRIPVRSSRSVVARVFRTKKAMAIPDAARDTRANARLVRLLKQTSLLCVPLLVRGEAIGTVLLGETRRIRRFSDEEIARAQTVANQAALAIENAVRHRDAVAARDRAEVLLETVRDCSSSVDLAEIARRVARRIVAMTSANRCTVFIPDASGKRIADIVEHGTPRGVRPYLEALRGRAFDEFPAGRELLRARKALVWDDIGGEGGIPVHVARQLDCKGIVAAPLIANGRFMAILTAAYPSSMNSVPADEIAVIEGVASQVALAVVNGRAFEEIRRQRQSLDVLTTRMIDAQEEERRRIARELHDGVSQTLTAVKFELERIARRPGSDGDIQHAAVTLGEAIGEVRRLCMDLRPSQLDHLGLPATLEWFGKSFGKRSGLEVTVDIGNGIPPLPPEVEINLYRIVQEALANASQHADATRAVVRLRARPRRVLLTVFDDGKGFDPTTIEHHEGRGMGLLTMDERAHLLGGDLTLRSRPGHGTTIEVSVPLRHEAPKGDGEGDEHLAAAAPVPAGHAEAH